MGIYSIDKNSCVPLGGAPAFDELVLEGEAGEVLEAGGIRLRVVANDVVLFFLFFVNAVLVHQLCLHEVVAVLRHATVH